ncbi:SLAP domain-containing protein [Lactobacillus kullabergensis]|uniref:SLAP domain-containing protein n=1 Tax=Lactobacillus kullabergensis TaxID=1218493 RepID=UPI003AF271A0
MSNVSGVKRKLKHNAYIYTKKTKPINNKLLKKNQQIKVYCSTIRVTINFTIS